MGAVLAARMGDNVGNHSSGFWAGLGMIAGMVAGAIIGGILIAATGGAILVLAAVAGGVAMSAGLGFAGERLGEAFDKDEATGTPCSPILKGCFTCLIETKPAARIFDISTLCLITKTPATIKDGSKTVYIGGEPASRHKDSATCTGTIIPLTKNTYIGGPTISSSEPYQHTLAGFFHDYADALAVEAEWAGKAALVLGIIGAIPVGIAAAATGGVMVGCVAGTLSLLGVGVGYYAGKGGTWLGKKGGAALDSAMGYTDQRFENFGGAIGGVAAGVGAGLGAGKLSNFVVGKISPTLGGKGGGSSSDEPAGGGKPAGEDDGAGGKPGDDEPAGGAKNEAKPDDPNDQRPDDVELPKTEDNTCKTCGKTGDEDSPPPEDTPPKPNEPNEVVKAAIKDLPESVQDAVAKSPKLQAQIEKLASDPAKPWKFVDRTGDPNFEGANCDRTNHVINLGKGYDTPGVVAHEVGHAAYEMPPEIPAESNGVRLSRDEYVDQNRNQNLADEGEAVFNEHATNDEIVSNGGKPIIETTDASGKPTAAADAYAQYKAAPDAPGARDTAIKAMGETYRNANTSTTGETYQQFYGKGYEEYFDNEVQPQRDAADAYNQGKNGTLPPEEALNRMQTAQDTLTRNRIDSWNKAVKDGRATQQAADNAIAALKAEQAARTAKYDAYRATLTQNAPTVPQPPTTGGNCPTCTGANETPNASDLAQPAPAQKNASGNKSSTDEKPMLGANGTQMTSKTIWMGPNKMRIDVENPNPGQRAGQIHFQQGDAKYLYDPATKTFVGAPKSMSKVMSSPEVQNAVSKGMRFLGEDQ